LNIIPKLQTLHPEIINPHPLNCEVNIADLKHRQTNTFTKYALTGFRNKAITPPLHPTP